MYSALVSITSKKERKKERKKEKKDFTVLIGEFFTIESSPSAVGFHREDMIGTFSGLYQRRV
jgi:hypothetical protein